MTQITYSKILLNIDHAASSVFGHFCHLEKGGVAYGLIKTYQSDIYSFNPLHLHIFHTQNYQNYILLKISNML